MQNRNFIALWIATWKCTLRCPYCINYLSGVTREQSAGILAPLDCDKWIDTWNKYAPKLLMISGGEPFLIPNLVEVIAELLCPITINTNLTQDIEEFIDKVSPRSNLSVLASYHPTQPQERFFHNIQRLQRAGHNVCVTFITYPKQLHLHEEVKEKCNERGLILRTETCLDLNNLLPYTEKEAQIAKNISPGCRHHFINAIPADRRMMCSGGHNYICVTPEGNVFRCTSKAVCEQGREVVGNILVDDNVISDIPMRPCTYGRCCPSDEDNIRRQLQ